MYSEDGWMTFEWDQANSEWTKENRGFDFEYASTVFLYEERLESAGYERGEEIRYHTIGKAAVGEILFIVFTWRQHAAEQICPIISARIAHQKEREIYGLTLNRPQPQKRPHDCANICACAGRNLRRKISPKIQY